MRESLPMNSGKRAGLSLYIHVRVDEFALDRCGFICMRA